MIITLEELNNIISNDNTFIIKCCGGAGNFIGCMLRGILYYKQSKLEKTHKLIIMSFPVYNGDFVISDIFEFSDNIYIYNNSKKYGYYIENSFKINDFKDINNYLSNPFEANEFSNFFLNLENNEKISKLKDYNCITYNSNYLTIPNIALNYCKELLKDFNIHIKSHINEKINIFLKQHKIGSDGNSIGIHYRGTDIHGDRNRDLLSFDKFLIELDMILKKDKNIKTIFICSDEENVEHKIKEIYKNNYTCVSFQKNSSVKKIPDLENYDWFINNPCDIKEIKDNDKINKSCGWTIQSYNTLEYIFNTWRDKYQVIDAIIDTIIFNSCSKNFVNTSSTLQTLGHLLINLNLL